MLEQGFDELDIQKIDGSGFIIDLDADGTADLIRMLLVDQGWFDTRPDVIGLIGDPLLPLVISESNLSTNSLLSSGTSSDAKELPTTGNQNIPFSTNQMVEIPSKYRNTQANKDQMIEMPSKYRKMQTINDQSICIRVHTV